ncbi:MAG: hypothetical protein H0T73_04875 [Ardenticatenales bacterium]|nr:hypothetical protein [Ardenticatenales bacterium]
MLPPSHVAYTLAALSEIQKRTGTFEKADYRLVALAAMGADLIDKPLAWAYFYKRYKSAVLFAHTLLFHLALFLLVFWKAPHRMVYALAFNGHALVDRLWFFPDTWYWPVRGWRFHVWRRSGSEQPDIKRAYWYTFTRRPELWLWELGGAVAFLWFVLSNRLWARARLKHILQTGRLLPEEESQTTTWPS